MDPKGTVKPRLLKGFRDILPGQMMARRQVIETLRAVFERYGFGPLDTPALEYADVLLGEYGAESTKELFRFRDPDGEDVAMRYDLTVSLARVVAQYADLPIPFRRYQIGNCWRWDKPGPGRFREFLQFDIDTVGTEETAADAEIVAGMCESLLALGIEGFVVRYSSRRLLNLLIRYAGVPEGRAHEVYRVLDKLDKHGRDEVRKELTAGRVDASGDKIPGLGLEAAQVERIDRFLSSKRPTNEETREVVSVLLAGVDGLEACMIEIASMFAHIEALGVDTARVRFDPTLARGLDYYTGLIFEGVLPDAPQYGTVFGGGRYEGLVERFLGKKIPGTGASIGVDRLLSVMLDQATTAPRKSTADVLVCVLDRERFTDYQRLTLELRRAGISTELFLGSAKGIGKQLKHADRAGIPLAVIAGGDEFAAGTVSIKNLREGSQRAAEVDNRESWLTGRFGQATVPRADMTAVVQAALKAMA